MAERCGNPSVDADALMPKKSKFDRSDKCVKCKEARGNLVIRHAVYCRNCFDTLILTRVHKTLEPHINLVAEGLRRKSTALRPAGDLLLGFSGGVGSTVLLDVVHRVYLTQRDPENAHRGGREHPRKERVWKKARAVYIEVADAFFGMRDKTDDVRMAVTRYEGIEFIPLRIQDAFDPQWWARITGSPTPETYVDLNTEDLEIVSTEVEQADSPLAAMQKYISSLPTSTATLSSIATIIRMMLLHTARATKSSHLLLGTSLTSLSISLVSSISQGGGFSVPQASQEEWTPPGVNLPLIDGKRRAWCGEVRVIRPLREAGVKECAAWAWWHRLLVVGKGRIPTTSQTVSGLTKDFIVGLEKDFPSTVSTISKTVGKLAPRGDAGQQCVICGLPTQRDVQTWKARTSIRSRCPQEDNRATAIPSLTPLICYACHTTLTSRSSRGSAPARRGALSVQSTAVRLPVWTAASLATRSHSSGGDSVDRHNAEGTNDRPEVRETRRLTEGEIKDVVAEFLLDDT